MDGLGAAAAKASRARSSSDGIVCISFALAGSRTYGPKTIRPKCNEVAHQLLGQVLA